MKLSLNDARISYSDCFRADVAPDRVTFHRPPWGAAGISEAHPGARVRVLTDATRLTLTGVNTAKVTRADAYCATGAVLVDGRFSKPFDAGPFRADPQTFQVVVENEGAQTRLYEFLMPHGAAVELTELDVSDGAALLPPSPRPARLYVAYGDSIAQGFAATHVAESWAWRLAERHTWRMINLGYGGRKATASDGITVGELKPDIVTFMVGYNDFAQQTDPTAFRTEVQGALAHILRLAPGASVYVFTPLWALRGALKPITLEQYRQSIRDTIAALHTPNLHLIEGEPLTAHDRTAFPDGTHPGNLGNTQIFLSLLNHIGV
jgi:lysophospholipase L1-like esterase